MPPPKKTTTSKAAPVPVPVTPSVAAVIERSEIKGSGKPAVVPVPPIRSITHDQIAKRAFEIYANRGYAPGDQNADWLEAERQLKAGL